MQNRLSRYFINGILTLVPIGLTIFLGVKTFLFLDGLIGQWVPLFLGFSIPGLGLILMLLFVVLIGFLATHWLTHKLVKVIDKLFAELPLVKSVYGIVKDTVHSLMGKKNSFSTVVAFHYGEGGTLRIGFMTNEMRTPIAGKDDPYVMVYVPQSFQVAGDLYLVPQRDVIPLDIPADEAMKMILSAGMTGKPGQEEQA